MFGDILSDEAAGLVGGLGMAPGLCIGDGDIAMAQATHGSAPDIAGKGIANPYAMIESTRMLLEWLGHRRGRPAGVAAAADIGRALRRRSPIPRRGRGTSAAAETPRPSRRRCSPTSAVERCVASCACRGSARGAPSARRALAGFCRGAVQCVRHDALRILLLVLLFRLFPATGGTSRATHVTRAQPTRTARPKPWRFFFGQAAPATEDRPWMELEQCDT